MRYVIVDGGRVVTTFAGPQDPSDKPGYQELDDAAAAALMQPTAAEIQAALDAVVTAWIDAQAAAAGFKDAAYLVSYYDSTNATWKGIARAFVPWRDGIWAACIVIVDAVKAGTRQIPTAEQLIAELPVFVP